MLNIHFWLCRLSNCVPWFITHDIFSPFPVCKTWSEYDDSDFYVEMMKIRTFKNKLKIFRKTFWFIFGYISYFLYLQFWILKIKRKHIFLFSHIFRHFLKTMINVYIKFIWISMHWVVICFSVKYIFMITKPEFFKTYHIS